MLNSDIFLFRKGQYRIAERKGVAHVAHLDYYKNLNLPRGEGARATPWIHHWLAHLIIRPVHQSYTESDNPILPETDPQV